MVMIHRIMESIQTVPDGLVLVHHIGADGSLVMTHGGLPLGWAAASFAVMGLVAVLAVTGSRVRVAPARSVDLTAVPGIRRLVRFLTGSPWPLVALRMLFAAAFLAVIVAGLAGTAIAERNLATVVTWNVWWILIIISVFFLGSAWCAVCPWDALAGWLVKRRLWRRASAKSSLNLPVPRAFRRVWPALVLLVGFTWLEVGLGIAGSPLMTVLLALLIVVLAAFAIAVFERKAFCLYACPVGRTIGFYSQLAPVELRPVDTDVCARCTTLDCYHGTDQVEPCPTHLTMGRFAQNTYCTSCGACVLSCPKDNVAWRLRSVAAEARAGARPHWDEAWFILALWAITSFHGLTMKPDWTDWLRALGRSLGDSEHLLVSFSIGMAATIALMVLVYMLSVAATGRLAPNPVPFRRLFSVLAFAVLPVTFAYHLAHNLMHLARESGGLSEVLANPLGAGVSPMKPMELYGRHQELLMPEQFLFALQAGLMVWGFWVAVQVLRYRGRGLFGDGVDLAGPRLVPMLLFVAAASAANLALLTHEMVMRL